MSINRLIKLAKFYDYDIRPTNKIWNDAKIYALLKGKSLVGEFTRGALEMKLRYNP